MKEATQPTAAAPAFALAGRIVKTERQARRVLRDAIANNKQWLIPQARSVARQLAAAARGVA